MTVHHRLVRRLAVVSGLLATAAFAQGTVDPPSAVQRSTLVLTPPSVAVPRAYFGIHVHRGVPHGDERASVWPDIGAGSLRLWDSYVSWPDLEPSPGAWRFERLDSLVALASSHHMSVYLTLGRTPRWASTRPNERSAYGLGEQAMPREIATWENYVRVVARRYRGRIAAYEVWNEPNQPGMFSGSVDDLTRLAGAAYRAVKAADPDALVISPSPVRGEAGIDWMLRFRAAGGLRYADVVGFHPYITNAPPEAMVSLLARLERQLNRQRESSKPVWITELGWFMQDRDGTVRASKIPNAFDHTVLSDTLAAAYVARALVLGWCTGAQRLMWYAWDNGRMGLLEHDRRTEKAPAIAFRTVSAWMAGSIVSGCARSDDGEWTVAIESSAHERMAIRWSESPKAESIDSGVVAGTALVASGAGRDDVKRAARWGLPMLLRGGRQ